MQNKRIAKQMTTEKPIRVQLKRTKGWRIPPNTVVVSRPSRFGNPFKTPAFPALIAVEHYRNLLTAERLLPPHLVLKRERILDALPSLRGKNLACWCGEGPCHADVLLELANKPTEKP